MAVLSQLCVVLQVAFEGQISKQSIQSELAKGNKASGDLIPWTVSQQFNDSDFAGLSGARVVRIATHPDVQKLGYGSRAMDLLMSYFQGDLSYGDSSLSVGVFGGESHVEADECETEDLVGESVAPRKKLPPLLNALSERPAERLHWIGVSYGLTSQLLNFWSRKGMRVCYVRQTANDLTGEYSAVMLRELSCEGVASAPAAGWLGAFVRDYRKRIISLFAFSFKTFDSAVSLTLVDPERELANNSESTVQVYGETPVTAADVDFLMTPHDLARLELYSRNMVDHHMILDILPTLARIYFMGKIPSVHLSPLQLAIFLACGLQHRDADDVTREVDLPANQVLAFFNKTIRKICTHLRSLLEGRAAKDLPSTSVIKGMERKVDQMIQSKSSLKEDQDADESEFRAKQRKLLMGHKDLSKHAVVLDEAVVSSTLQNKSSIPSSVSFKVDVKLRGEESGEKKRKSHVEGSTEKKKKLKNRSQDSTT